MTLMVNGKKVVGYALGGTEFYSIGEHADGSISFNGHTYERKTKTSDSFECTYSSGDGTTPYSVSVSLNQSLSSGSALTIKDLINKGEKIKLIVTFNGNDSTPNFSLDSGMIDLSKPDSNGHFNFQWLNGATSTNTYCCSDSSTFTVYSDAISAYSGANYDSGHMTIIYPDES